MTEREKPQGQSGEIELSGGDAEWKVIDFPSEKRARELMVAEVFIRSANKSILYECAEKYRPFSDLIQNTEDNLDFTITTARGVKGMELVEFAPLDKLGMRFENAPRRLDQTVKNDLLLELVREKSKRQGRPGTIGTMLLIYATEYGFKLDPLTIEIVRRDLDREQPRFERIYYISVHNKVEGGVREIFPGMPDNFFGDQSEQKLRGMKAHMPHPSEFTKEWEFKMTTSSPHYGPINLIIRFRVPLVLRDRNQQPGGGGSSGA